MELLEQIRNNLLLILTLLFFFVMALRGYHRGLLHMVASFGALAASIFVAKTLMPKLSQRLMQNNSWVSFVSTKILPKLPSVTLEQVMSGISFLILFIISVVIIGVLVSSLGKLTRHPFVGFVDKTLGMALGLVEALIYIWVFMLFVDIMPQLSFCEKAAAQIASDPFLSLLHDKNCLMAVIQTGKELLQ